MHHCSKTYGQAHWPGDSLPPDCRSVRSRWRRLSRSAAGEFQVGKVETFCSVLEVVPPEPPFDHYGRHIRPMQPLRLDPLGVIVRLSRHIPVMNNLFLSFSTELIGLVSRIRGHPMVIHCVLVMFTAEEPGVSARRDCCAASQSAGRSAWGEKCRLLAAEVRI